MTPLDVSGHWSWSQETTRGGVMRVESEEWTLIHDAEKQTASITGHYVRRVRFRDQRGTSFACSQSPEFVLETRFELVGEHDGDSPQSAATLRETSATVVPSPCSQGERALGRYAVSRDDKALILRGESTQRLTPAAAPTVEATPADKATEIAGSWHFESQTENNEGIVRRESEVWTLAVDAELITGSYARTIKLTMASGKALACSGTTEVTLVDTYKVDGWVRKAGLELSEQSVVPSQHPCAPGETRHLDVARGTAFREHLVLIWRGQRRQVLSRTTTTQ